VFAAAAQTEKPEPVVPEIPEQVALPVSHPIPVILDTPLSTLDSKQGQLVTFRLKYSILLDGRLEVPPNTEILGHIVEVKRGGHFDKQGVLRLAVDRIQLHPAGGTNLEAHLDAVDTKGKGPPETDKPASNEARSVAIDSVGGTVTGAAIGGAEGAGIGAGAGIAAAVLILMSRRGQELYLQQGAPFTVTLDQPAYLSGADVYVARQNFKQNPGPYGVEVDSENGDMPKLKHRRPPQQ